MFKISGAEATVWQTHYQDPTTATHATAQLTQKPHEEGPSTLGSWRHKKYDKTVQVDCCFACPVQHSGRNLTYGTSARLNYETYALWMIHDLSRTASQTTLFADISSAQHKRTAIIQRTSYHTDLRQKKTMANLGLTKKSVKIPNIKFHENPSSGNRTVACGLTWLS